VIPRTHQDLGEVVAQDEARLHSRILRGTAWVAVGYGSRNLFSLLTTLVLVRLLEPRAFGLVALAWTVLVVCDQIQSAGTTSALIFRRGDIRHAAGTALVFLWCTASLLYGFAFFVAPFVADLFRAPDLTGVLRALTLLLVIRSFSAVPATLLERNLQFRTRAMCEVGGGLAQGVAAISLAFAGAGVWSLVIGQLVGSLVSGALTWAVSPWLPDPRLASFPLLKELVGYGRYISGTNILNIANNTVDNIVVGRVLGTGQLGFYSVGYRLADAPNTVIGQIVAGGRVMFPVYSIVRNDLNRFWRIYVETLQRVALLALPVSVGVFVLAAPIVHGLLGSGWEPTITPLRVLAIFGVVKSFSTPSGEVFKGAGRPELGLLVAAVQITLAIPSLIILVHLYGLKGAAIAMTGVMTVNALLRFWLTFRLLKGSMAELGRALAPSALCSALLGLFLFLLLPATDGLSDIAALVVPVVLGAILYIGLTYAFARQVVRPMWGGLRGVHVR
jgi:O-antigen/teichoic acid export membrane protein